MKSKKAFSLIELSIVILIIGVLVAGVLTASGLYQKLKLTTARTTTESSPVNGIKDLTLWLDATSSKGLIDSETEDGATISNWYDINNQHELIRNHVAQSSVGNKPTYSTSGINGIPAIKFDGVDDYLFKSNVTGSDLLRYNQITVFVVQKFIGNSSSSSSALFWGDASNMLNLQISAGSLAFDFSGSGGATTRTSASLDDNFYTTPKIISFTHKESSYMDIKVNGAIFTGITSSTGTLPEASAYSLNIGATSFGEEGGDAYFKGYIGEVIVFDRALTDEERNSIESYLSKKWSIPLDGVAGEVTSPEEPT